MKQVLLVVLLSCIGLTGSITYSPAAAVLVYYFFAVLRPQWLWRHIFRGNDIALLTWSFYLAAAAIGSYLLWSIGLISYGKKENSVMRFSPALTWANVAMLGFAFWITLSYIFSNNQKVSEDWFGEYLKIFVMYFVAWRVLRTANQMWAMYMLTFLGLAYIALDANQIYIMDGRVILNRQGFALLDNNGAGLLLAMGVPLSFYAWEMTVHRIRWVYLFLGLSLVHAVLTTYSRGAMGSMIAPMPWYAFFSWKFARNKIHVALIAFATVIAVGFMAGKEIQDRFFSIEKREVDASFQSRQLSWKIAWEIAADYPVFGAGVRCSAIEMKQRGADMEGRTIHSQYLQILADSGYMAFGLYIIAGLTTFLALWQARWKLWDRKDPEGRRALAMVNGIECSLVSFFVGAGFLSLEVFEPSYLMLLLGAQMWALLCATDTCRPELQRTVPLRPRVVVGTPRATVQGPPTGKHPLDRFQQPRPLRSGS